MRPASNLIASLMLVSAFGMNSVPLAAAEEFSPYVDAEGNISLPDGFRTSMVHLGSWFVPEGGASGFHDVYTEKESVEAYRRTGKFPDGATLVKELRASKSGSYTTGQGVSYATNGIKQWFVMIKDSKNRFAGNTLWGEGWGWALYKPDDPTSNVATNFQTDCLGCHVPAKNQDWLYTEAYPTLSAD
jgi:hypothetical protein